MCIRDSIWGANELRRLSGAPIYAYEEEKKVCENAAMNVSDQAGRPETVIPDHYVKDGELLEFAGMRFRLIATPGHTAGSCCYYMEEEKILLSGDTLFCLLYTSISSAPAFHHPYYKRKARIHRRRYGIPYQFCGIHNGVYPQNDAEFRLPDNAHMYHLST